MRRICLALAFAAGRLVAQPGAGPVIFQTGIPYAQFEGGSLLLDLARPADPDGPRPLVVCIHGGAWVSGSRRVYEPVLRMLAAQGYAAASLDYRLAPRHRFPAQLEDVRQALRHLGVRAGDWGIDPARTVLLGDSAGGHLALLAGLAPGPANDSPTKVRAIVNLFGVADLTTWNMTTEDGRIEGLTAGEILEAAFGTRDRASPALKRASPLHRISPGNPAVLTFHGDADPVVAVSQARALHGKLKAAGVVEQLEIVNGAGHGFTGPDLARVSATAIGFLEAVLGLTPPVAFERIDAHVHAAPPPEVFLHMLSRKNVRLLNVTVVDPLAAGFDKTEPQTTLAIQAAEHSHGRIRWVSTFDPAGWESPGFADQVTRQLEDTFAHGAVAVKIYKSIGTQLASAGGRYVLPDDPAFSPILEAIAGNGKTLLAHLGEPRSSWRPLDPNDPHSAYYAANPAWHMYRHPERPSWEAIIAARDRMLARHPTLRVVGCHLGSMEHDVDEIARRFEKYPNFAVDTAARVPDLMRQPRDKVREFLIRYQDRVLWGTDLMELKWEDPAATTQRWQAAYDRDWKFFASAETLRLGGRQVQGLALPEAVLRRIFRDNALRWIPGLAETPAALSSRGE